MEKGWTHQQLGRAQEKEYPQLRGWWVLPLVMVLVLVLKRVLG